MKNKENFLKDKSYKFALRIVELYKHLAEEKGRVTKKMAVEAEARA